MSAATYNAQTKVDAEGIGRIKPIDPGFRWIDGTTPTTLLSPSVSDDFLEISIQLKNGRPKAKLQLKVTADTGTQKYGIREDNQNTVRPVLHHRIPCNETKEPVIELVEYRRKHVVLEDKELIFSLGIQLEEDELYTEKTQINDEGGAIVTITFAYTPGGEQRKLVENARRITEEQKVVLDKIKHIHRFFQALEKVSDAVEDVHPYIKIASTAILLLYKLCEKQKECRDAARDLVDEMDTFLSSGAEELGGVLRTNSSTKAAFRSLAVVIEDICKFIEKNSTGMAGSLLRGAISTSYESKLKELKEKLAKAKEGLRDSLNFGTWKRVLKADLRDKLESISRAHYSPGEGCLENTRKALLTDVDGWIRGSSEEKTAWVHGYAGSGKSALLNSIAERLERARIPFACFPCKRDDPDLSNVHKILSTIAYIFAEYYGDYSGFLSETVDETMGRSVLTGNIKKQGELLFGEKYEHISPKEVDRPSVHVILIDALDECRNHRDGGKTTNERRALLNLFIDLANAVPWIKILITSRPEPDIVDTFSKNTSTIHRININDDKWGTSTDIRLYIEAQSKELELDLSPDQVERFQAKASGLFIWCTTVFRFIQESKERLDTVDNILKDQLPDPDDDPHTPLYFLYQRILSSAVSRAQDKELMESILSMIFVTATRRPLSAEAIADTLYPNEESEWLKRKRKWVENIIRSLSAIIYVEEGTKLVRVCHPSVLDFAGGMLSGRLSITLVVPGEDTARHFSVRPEEIHTRVFNGCFTLMNRSLRFNICELVDSFRLNEDVPDLPIRIAEHITEALQYACLFWFSHLRQSRLKGCDALVLTFLSSLKLLFWVEALSLMDAINRGISVLKDCARFFTGQHSVTEIAGEWVRFLLAYGDASKSTPHLYLSALSWLPSNSRLWDIVRGSFSSELPMIANVPRVWSTKEAASDDRPSTSNSASVRCVSYVPNSCLIASASDDESIRLWDTNTGAAVGQLMQGRTLAVSNTGEWLVSGSGDFTLRIWDVDSGIPLGGPLIGHTQRITSVAVSPNNHFIASASDDCTVRLWNVATHQLLMTLEGHEEEVACVTFSADGNRVISGSYDCTIRMWDTWTGGAIGYPLEGHSFGVIGLAVSPDGQWIASASDDFRLTVRVWSMSTLSVVHVFKPVYSINYEATTTVNARFESPPSVSVQSVTFSRDSQFLISSSWSNTVSAWNVQTAEVVGHPLSGHTSDIRSIAFALDGYEFASGSKDGTIRIWDTRACTDLDWHRELETNYSQLGEDELRIRWYTSRAHRVNKDGWVRDGDRLLLWVPLQHRADINGGTKLVIDGRGEDTVRVKADYRKVFRFSGSRWKDIYTADGTKE